MSEVNVTELEVNGIGKNKERKKAEYAILEQQETGSYVEVQAGLESLRAAETYIRSNAADMATELVIVKIARRIKLTVKTVQKVSFE